MSKENTAPEEKKLAFFTFSRSVKRRLEALQDLEAGKLAKAIFRYAFDREIPKSLKLPESVFFQELREEIDTETAKREKLRELRRELGKRGAEARRGAEQRAQEIIAKHKEKTRQEVERQRRKKAERTPAEIEKAKAKERERSRRRRASYTPEQRKREALRSKQWREKAKKARK